MMGPGASSPIGWSRQTPTASRWGEERHHTAQVLPGFTLDGGTQPFLNMLNDSLITQPTVALLIPDYDPQEARRKLYLTTHISLLPYSNAADSDKQDDGVGESSQDRRSAQSIGAAFGGQRLAEVNCGPCDKQSENVA